MIVVQINFPYQKNIKRILLFFSFVMFSTGIFCQEVFRYISSADHVDLKLWISQHERSFDSKGIITQKNEYHALTIAGFGILCYEDFIVSGDSASYKYAINQYKYFCDSSKIDYIDNFRGIGLPYKFKFYDLKSPWYSGMTQGVAISFMLRYYKLTYDEKALEKARQIAYFMLRPIESGGTIGKTPEGYTFIEEYPNSKINPQVLNGFINGLIGIREYLNFFPDDTLAQRVHDESFDAMIKTFREYDLPDNWTNYNRANKRVSNHYMRYQITELEFLNFIYSDFRLVKQMMIWSFFAYNKIDNSINYYKNPQYQYAVPLVKVQDKISNNYLNFENTLTSDTSFLITKQSKISTNQMKRKKGYLLHLKDSAFSFHINFDKDIENEQWNFKIGNISSDSINIKIDSKKMTISCKEKFDRLEISFSNKKEKMLNIANVKVYNRYQFDIPRFGYYIFEKTQELQADSLYMIECNGEYLNETLIFYRFAPDLQTLKNARYELNNTISLKHPYFKPENAGYYQFFLSTPMIKGYWISSPSLKPVRNESPENFNFSNTQIF